MPGTLVATGLKALCLLRSKVSDCGGPPIIHRRMHALGFEPGVSAARAARPWNHGAAQEVATPAAVRRKRSRRETGDGPGMGRLREAAGGAAIGPPLPRFGGEGLGVRGEG